MNTMQQEFDAVVSHLYKQGSPAMDGGLCVYRSTDGLMCALGCRIPEGVYATNMEGRDMNSLMVTHGGLMPDEFHAYKGMFSDLQTAHDYCPTYPDGTFSTGSLSARLARVARDYDLNFTPQV